MVMLIYIYIFGLQVRAIRNKFIIYRKTFARVDMLASPAIQNDSVCHISFVFCGRDQKFLALLSLLFSLEAVFMLHYCLTYKSANIEEKAD